MSAFTASYFSSRTCCATKLLPLSATVYRPFAHTSAQTGQISYLEQVQANARLHVWGGSPLTWFFVRTLLRRARCFSLSRTLPVIALRWPVPAANRIYKMQL